MKMLWALLLLAPAGLTNAEYERLQKELRLKSKPWATIPWKGSVTEARELALKEKKPIFMMVDTGNPIGFA
jgi:hypothetical protein